MLFHLFQDKERVLRRSRDGVSFQGHNIRFFQDYSADLSRRQANFGTVKATLDKEGVWFSMLYTARLRHYSRYNQIAEREIQFLALYQDEELGR